MFRYVVYIISACTHISRRYLLAPVHVAVDCGLFGTTMSLYEEEGEIGIKVPTKGI